MGIIYYYAPNSFKLNISSNFLSFYSQSVIILLLYKKCYNLILNPFPPLHLWSPPVTLEMRKPFAFPMGWRQLLKWHLNLNRGHILYPKPKQASRSVRSIWYVSLSICFQFLNNITCIFTHFFTHMNFLKKLKTVV